MCELSISKCFGTGTQRERATHPASNDWQLWSPLVPFCWLCATTPLPNYFFINLVWLSTLMSSLKGFVIVRASI